MSRGVWGYIDGFDGGFGFVISCLRCGLRTRLTFEMSWVPVVYLCWCSVFGGEAREGRCTLG